MKKIEAIVRRSKLEPLKEALQRANVQGMTVSQVHGCGKQFGWKEYYRGSEVMVNMRSKVKFEVVVTDEQCESLIDLIVETARTGEVGDGKVFVFDVAEAIRIRTGGRGEDAIL